MNVEVSLGTRHRGRSSKHRCWLSHLSRVARGRPSFHCDTFFVMATARKHTLYNPFVVITIESIFKPTHTGSL